MSFRLRCLRAAVMSTAMMGSLPAATMAQESPTPAAEKAKSEKDRYAVPAEDDTAALVQFINGLLQYQPTTEEEAATHQEKLLPALRTAAERIRKLEKDSTSEASVLAQRLLLQVRLVELPKASEKDAEQLMDDLEKYLTTLQKPELLDYGMAVQLARGLEQTEHPLAAKAYERFGALLAKHDDKAVAMRGKLMEGAARRLSLVGKPMELTGTTIEGKQFRLEDLKGKVVLVDFWATWCGPCKAELPNIKANYDKYHDKGFEVVGVSIDQDRVALEDYLKEQQIPWSTLHENDGKGDHPAMMHYAIEAIPFMALVGRDGKVLSIQARGESLSEILAEQFKE